MSSAAQQWPRQLAGQIGIDPRGRRAHPPRTFRDAYQSSLGKAGTSAARIALAGLIVGLTAVTAEAQTCPPGAGCMAQREQRQIAEPRQQQYVPPPQPRIQPPRQPQTVPRYVPAQQQRQYEAPHRQPGEPPALSQYSRPPSPPQRLDFPPEPGAPPPARAIGRPTGTGTGAERSRATAPPTRDPYAGSYVYHDQSFARFRVPPYRWPPHLHYARCVVGGHFPLALLITDYIILDWMDYGLTEPADGYQWVRYGPDLVLVDADTGQIVEVIYGVFAETPAADDQPPQDADDDAEPAGQ